MTDERARPPIPTVPDAEPDDTASAAAYAVAPPDTSPFPRAVATTGATTGATTATGGTNGMGGVRGVAPPEAARVPSAVSPTGSGQDVRHRGWYWHWNTLITQYAPLLGLKGVGLLNSYTVWTDRREGSPHQGYAFPAQESEARFYGEGREELITLNKVLVALDLIEIHKEMVLRQDARGRRWRVPHNFYRVKDPRDGLVLSLPAVVRVLEVARRDRNVFRHIRHIFGPQFAPIDRTSLWHLLLPQLRALPLWQEMEAQAARERRAPRKATRAGEEHRIAVTPVPAAAADAPPPAPEDTVDSGGDIDLATTVIGDDAARIFSTFLSQSTVRPIDEDTADADNDAVSVAHAGESTYVVSHDDTEETAFAPAGADVTPADTEGDSISDEGTTKIEYGSMSIVGLDDSTEDQEGKTKEETTRTSSTSTPARTRTREEGEEAETDTATDRSDPPTGTAPASPPLPEVFHAGDGDAMTTAVSPPETDTTSRPAVSDLFAALAERNRRTQAEVEGWYRRANLPRAVAVWEERSVSDASALPNEAAAVAETTAPTDAESAFDPKNLPDPDTMPGQPLPPEPGEVGQQGTPGEGTIVVRALDVRAEATPDGTQASLLAEIEQALTMANSRPPSDMEISLLWQVAQDCDAAARVQPGPESGLGWVLAAIWEAVRSGSSFVAPKRIAAICDRWAAQGFMSDGRTTPAPPPPRVLQPPPARLTAIPEREPEPDAPPEPPSPAAAPSAAPAAAAIPDVTLTDEEGTRLWTSVLRRLDGVLHADALQSRPFATARVIGVAGDRATVYAPDAESAARLGTYRGLLARRLGDALGRPITDVTFTVVGDEPQTTGAVATALPSPLVAPLPAALASLATADTPGSGPLPVIPPVAPGGAVLSPLPQPSPVPQAEPPLVPPTVPTFTVAGTEQTNHALWARALHALREEVSEATFKVWLQSAALIAADADGTLVIGARNRVQRERLERQHTGEIAAALGVLLGRAVAVRVVVIGDTDALRRSP